MRRLALRVSAFLCALLGLGSSASAQEVDDLPTPPAYSSNANPQGLAVFSTLPIPVINQQWQGMVTDGAYPPDTHGAAGTLGLLAVVNYRVEYFGKCIDIPGCPQGGTPIWGPVPLSQFFSGAGSSIYDPHSIYDASSGRFYVVALEHSSNQSWLDLAVSKGANPQSSGSADWYFYRQQTTEMINGLPYGGDRPGLGVDSRALYFTCNMVSLPFTVNASFIHTQIIAFSKTAINSNSITYTSTDTPDDPYVYSGFNLQPATVYGTADPGNVAYFAETPLSVSGNSVTVWSLSDPLGAHTLNVASVSVPNNSGAAVDAPQYGTTNKLSVARERTRTQGNASWYNGALWFTHTAGGSDHAIVYYYKVNTNGFPNAPPTLSESGGIDGGTGVWNFAPAIGCNANGDICLVYTQSSASMYATIMVATHGSAATSFSTPIVLKASPAYYTPQINPSTGLPEPRWGDFAVVTPDPSDNTFWVASEWVRSTAAEDWGTWWGSISVPATRWVPEGVALALWPQQPYQPKVASDGAGGAMTVWFNRAGPITPGIYVSDVTANGAIATGFPIGGLRIGLHGDELGQQVVADGTGGAYVTWFWGGNYVILQRVTSAGVAAGWPLGGVFLGLGTQPQVAADGTGGALVAWYNSGSIVQRITSVGAVASGWPPGGLRLNNTGAWSPVVVGDGTGGAIVAWQASGGVTAQHVNSSGAIDSGWPSGGLVVGPGGGPKVVSDGAGGALIAYGTSQGGLAATRVTGQGTVAPGWSTSGVSITTTSVREYGLTSDGAGGIVAGWIDGRDSGWEIFAQRVLGSGVIPHGWITNGVGVVVLPPGGYPLYYRSDISVAPDGTGGAIITWDDLHNTTGCSGGPIIGCDFDIYGDRVNGWGVVEPTYPTSGHVISSVLTVQQYPSVLLSTPGQAIAAWEDNRPDESYCQRCARSIFAQSVSYDGVPPAAIDLYGSQGCYDHVYLNWTAPGNDGTSGTAAAYDLRSSSSPITTDASFWSATQIPTPAPQPAGSAEQMTLPAGCSRRYYAIRARDNSFNYSSLGATVALAAICPKAGLECYERAKPAREPDGAPEVHALTLDIGGPNPTSGVLRFRIGVPPRLVGSTGKIAVFDISGRVVRTLGSGLLPGGWTALEWDGKTEDGRRARSGVYFARLAIGQERIVRTVVIR
jgi:hypothetical protein